MYSSRTSNFSVAIVYILLFVVRGDTGVCKWKVSLPATIGGDKAFTISAVNQKQTMIELKDVLFGDVWLCSGQSNMQFAMSQVNYKTWLTSEYFLVQIHHMKCQVCHFK